MRRAGRRVAGLPRQRRARRARGRERRRAGELPYGLDGGLPGAAGRLFHVRDGQATALPSKIGNLRLRRGDAIRLETSGGGGFGPPLDRPGAEVAADLAGGYVTAADGE